LFGWIPKWALRDGEKRSEMLEKIFDWRTKHSSTASSASFIGSSARTSSSVRSKATGVTSQVDVNSENAARLRVEQK